MLHAGRCSSGLQLHTAAAWHQQWVWCRQGSSAARERDRRAVIASHIAAVTAYARQTPVQEARWSGACLRCEANDSVRVSEQSLTLACSPWVCRGVLAGHCTGRSGHSANNPVHILARQYWVRCMHSIDLICRRDIGGAGS